MPKTPQTTTPRSAPDASRTPAAVRSLAPAALVLTLLAAATVVAAATPAPLTPVGPALTLNETLPCLQDLPEAARLATGETVVTWVDNFPEELPGVSAQILGPPGPSGIPLGHGLRIDSADDPLPETYSTGAAVAAVPDGGFLVAWWGRAGISPEFTAFAFLRAFDGAGSPLGPTVEIGVAGGPLVLGLALATDAGGRPAVAWTDSQTVWLRLFEADLTPRGGLIPVAGPVFPPPPGSGGIGGFRGPDLAIAEGGELLVGWSELHVPADPSILARYETVRVRRFGPSGDALGPAVLANDLSAGSFAMSVAVAALDGGGYAVAWDTEPVDGVEAGVYARLLGADGDPVGPGFQLNATPIDRAADPSLAPLPGGGFLAAWEVQSFDLGFTGVRVRVFGPGGAPVGGDVEAGPEPEFLQGRPSLAVGDDGGVWLAWRDYLPIPPILPPACYEQVAIRARPFRLGCIPSGERLCLQGGRFAVEVEVDDPRLGAPFPRPAAARPLTDDTGTFWFFRPENVELMLKVLDGRGVNGHFWFFSGALSNVGYEVVVTDTLAATERRYENRPGELASHADTRAFADPLPPPGSAASVLPESAAPPGPGPVPAGDPGTPPAGTGRPASQASCSDPHVLCLHGELFAIRVDWHDPRTGATGTAFAEPLSDRSGTFWFFRPDNRELVFKVLDGTAINFHFWVFFGALTDLEYTITVENRFNGCGWSYHNPPFALTSHADTRAMNGLPLPCPPSPAGTAAAPEP